MSNSLPKLVDFSTPRETFLMGIELMLKNFITKKENQFDFPSTLSEDERVMVKDVASKLGLKFKTSGKGLDTQIIVFKSEDQLVLYEHPMLLTRNRSRHVIMKILETLKEMKVSLSSFYCLRIANINVNFLPFSFVVIGNISNRSKNQISVPPTNINFSRFESRQRLPIFQYRNNILNFIANHQIVIIESSTGYGKSTQIPQYVLEEYNKMNKPCRIIVAEPKSICVTTLAKRISFERGESLGTTVGYQIRLESKIAPTSNLIFVKSNSVIRILMSEKPEEFFQNISMLIIDEVQTRDVFCDFLLLCVKENLHLYPHLKVIILSSTAAANKSNLSSYFDQCPIVKLPEIPKNIKEFFLEDILKEINFEVPQDVSACVPGLVKDFSDDMKKKVDNLLIKMTSGDEFESAFLEFCYIVETKNVPVDYRCIESHKTPLMIAVEGNLEEQVVMLLKLQANILLTIKMNEREMTVYDIAVAKKNEKIQKILMNYTRGQFQEMLFDDMKSSPQDRMLLNCYYKSLMQPGVYLENVIDFKLLTKVISNLHFNTPRDETFLVFLPDLDDIVHLSNNLFSALDTNYEIFILNNRTQNNHQLDVFSDLPKHIRKIILATNIAESSIIVNNVTYVIDSGRQKQKTFNPINRISSSETKWIDKESAEQRKKRATGKENRTGVVYRFYSRDCFKYFANHSKLEILRCDLSNICLKAAMVLKSDGKIAEFLSKAIDPPSSYAISHIIQFLHLSEALQYNEKLTELGFYLADIQINTKHAKMIIYGILFKCLDPVLTIVSILAAGDPFSATVCEDDRKKCQKLKEEIDDGTFSDHFVLLRIFQKWNEYITTNKFDDNFCDENFVNSGTMFRVMDIRQKILGYLRSMKLVHSVGNLSAYNQYSCNYSMIKMCIVAGSYPDIARVIKETGEIVTKFGDKVSIDPGSVVKPGNAGKDQLLTQWMIFEEKNRNGEETSAKICTLATDLSVIFACGYGAMVHSDSFFDDKEKDPNEIVEIKIDNFIKFSAEMGFALGLWNIRKRVNVLMDRFLSNPEKFKIREEDEVLIHGIATLLQLEDEDAGFKFIHDGISARPRVVTCSSIA
ncbi:CLUMA_CG001232, isoform A [Clunio marinus]|uniref:CLUMA_CG001232, isoform A n=1 Tax=Clunio marinus TaxID=568069 RepID=A0A1J1HLU1_9DIPT|nr:CLUMA_CG001232, isoform A [Clunio marinus]